MRHDTDRRIEGRQRSAEAPGRRRERRFHLAPQRLAVVVGAAAQLVARRGVGDPARRIVAEGESRVEAGDQEHEPAQEGGPRGVIRGEKSRIVRINQMQVLPQRREIVVAMPGIFDRMEPPDAFIGVWSYDDNGDVPAKFEIPIGQVTKLKKPFGVVLDLKHKEVIVSDMRNQGILSFSVPEIF